MITTLSAEALIEIHAEGVLIRSTSPFEDPVTMHTYREVLTRRGEDWASSVLCRDLTRRSLTWGPWLEQGEPEILVLADQREAQS